MLSVSNFSDLCQRILHSDNVIKVSLVVLWRLSTLSPLFFTRLSAIAHYASLLKLCNPVMQKYFSFGFISSICLNECKREIEIIFSATSNTFKDLFFVQITSKIVESPSDDSKF